MSIPAIIPHLPLEEKQAIEKITQQKLQAAGLLDCIPTPINELMAALHIRQFEGLEDHAAQFISDLAPKEAARHGRTWKKVKGMADLDHRQVYLPDLGSAQRNSWRDVHETTHIILPWHKMVEGQRYSDCDLTLSQRTLLGIECEANCGASSFIYQPQVFIPEVNDSPLSFESICDMANRYGGSIKATFITAIQARRDDYIGICYLKNDYASSSSGVPIFHKPVSVLSSSLAARNVSWVAPFHCQTDWATAFMGDASHGETTLPLGNELLRVQWQSLWTTYDLLVLLQIKKPSFHSAFSQQSNSTFVPKLLTA